MEWHREIAELHRGLLFCASFAVTMVVLCRTGAMSLLRISLCWNPFVKRGQDVCNSRVLSKNLTPLPPSLKGRGASPQCRGVRGSVSSLRLSHPSLLGEGLG